MSTTEGKLLKDVSEAYNELEALLKRCRYIEGPQVSGMSSGSLYWAPQYLEWQIRVPGKLGVQAGSKSLLAALRVLVEKEEAQS